MGLDIERLADRFDHNALETRDRCGALYAELQEKCPVFHSSAWGGFWGATRHETLRRIGRDTETFASGFGVMVPPMGHGRPLVPMEADGALHQSYRSILLPWLGPAAVASLDPVVREVTGGMLDALLSRGEADLYEEYAKRIPTILITRLLDIEDSPEFWEWTETLIYTRLDEAQGDTVKEAADSLLAFFREVVAERTPTQAGRGDLVSVLIAAHQDGRIETEEEVVELCFFLLIAGLENTAFGIRAALWHFGAYPRDRDRVLADPGLIRPAVEECLRLYAPVTGLARHVTASAELDECRLEPGDRVLLLYGAAGRDPALFESPDEFRLDRRGNPHLAFGVGAHRCIGSHLARLEMKIALEELFVRIPHYELTEPAGTSWHPAGPLTVRWE
jgi:cytochrome P450